MTVATTKEPAAPARASALACAVLLATAPSDTGAAAAAQPWEGSTIAGKLADQLRSLGVADIHVITRPEWRDELSQAGEVHVSESAAGDLRQIAELARAANGGVVIAYADMVTQREALAGVLADRRVATNVLCTRRRLARPFTFKLRRRRGRVMSAQSAYHHARRADWHYLGLLKVAAQDREALIEVAESLVALLDGPPPEDWEQELEVKARVWHAALNRRRARAGDHDDEEDDLDADLEEDALSEPPADADDDDEDDDEEGADHGASPLQPDDEQELLRRVAIARRDVSALLLVGLVRSGVRVSGATLRSLFWARPLSRDAVNRAAARIGSYDEERALLKLAVKRSDGFFTTFFVSPYSKYIARYGARHGWTPNGVTIVSMAVGVLAAAAFATGERAGLIAGAILLQAAFTLDCVDGQLARYTRTFTTLGAWLDSVFDRTKEYLVYAGLAIGASRAGDPVWLLAGAALGLQTARHALDFAFPAVRQTEISLAPQPPIEVPWDYAGPNRPRRLRQGLRRGMPKPPAPPRKPRKATPPSPATRIQRRLDASDRLRWVRKMIALPIGERFAAISITAAIADARTTFTVLLAWGGFAALYAVVGRLIRSLSA